MRLINDIALGGIRALAQSTLFQKFIKGRVVVFLYHDITDKPARFSRQHNLCVPPLLMEEQLNIIRRYFTIISPLQLLSGNYTKPAALITFDDGLVGSFEYGHPILARNNCPVAFFINMGPVYGEVFWAGLLTHLYYEVPSFKTFLKARYSDQARTFLVAKPEDVSEFLDAMDRVQIERNAREYYGEFVSEQHLRELGKYSEVYLGNHLYNHYNAARLSAEMLARQYQKNKARLLEFKNSLDMFSYPFGQRGICWNNKTHAVIKGQGACMAFSSCGTMRKEKAGWLVDRIALDESVNSDAAFRERLVKGWVKTFID